MPTDTPQGKTRDPDRHYARTVPSRMAVFQHPLHPMVVVYPISFLSMLVVADAVFLWRADPFWAMVAYWLNVAGLGLGLFAALFGIGDLLLQRVIRSYVATWSHFIAAVMLLAMAAVGVWLRSPDPVSAVWPWGLVQSSLTLFLVMLAGWLGGTLSFRHGIGVYGDGERVVKPEDREQD